MESEKFYNIGGAMTPVKNLNHQFRRYPRVQEKRKVIRFKETYEKQLRKKQLNRLSIYQTVKQFIPIIVKPENKFNAQAKQKIKYELGLFIKCMDKIEDDDESAHSETFEEMMIKIKLIEILEEVLEEKRKE